MIMHNSTRQPPRSIFSYLEQVFHPGDTFLYGLPGRYLNRLLFLFLLGMVYVGNTHFFERTVRRISTLERDVNALRVDYTTQKASYMFMSKQSEVAKRVKEHGLCEVPLPPYTIQNR